MDKKRLQILAGVENKKILVEGVDPQTVGDIVHDAVWDVLNGMKVKAPDHTVDDAIASAIHRYEGELEAYHNEKTENEELSRPRW